MPDKQPGAAVLEVLILWPRFYFTDPDEHEDAYYWIPFL